MALALVRSLPLTVGLLGLLGLLFPNVRAQTAPSVESALRELFNGPNFVKKMDEENPNNN